MEGVGDTGDVDVKVKCGGAIARKGFGSNHFGKVQTFSLKHLELLDLISHWVLVTTQSLSGFRQHSIV